eukprot:CAMPEP_0115172590 /NCGR_PEP_ID=MMETSP0270-20121206/2893_1 /TAXON_ID=71861 /ORGANISM="Scrippsiella trochoidea, Strain CCMP3099" /LENGTH=46 /DNA_ID= /DNA_START= /DNA_END= /DNA_ORIENTATION=
MWVAQHHELDRGSIARRSDFPADQRVGMARDKAILTEEALRSAGGG